MSDSFTSMEKHGAKSVTSQGDVRKLLLRSGAERYEVECDAGIKKSIE